MPIELFTGLPGNGKTALMVERLVAEAAKAERPIFAAGIDGLAPGLATVLDDPRRWNERDADGNPLVPDGALIFIDEAWKWFGHLHDASRQATPKHVLDLAEHRHRGIDFVWTTQQPAQIYPFARGLIATHYHVVRRFGTPIIDLFRWEELQEDVKSSAKRDLAQRTTRALPKDVFGLYKSAELHTIKARVPLKVLALPLLLVAAIFAVWLAFKLLPAGAGATSGDSSEGSEAAAAAPSLELPSAERGRGKRTYASVDEYVAAHMPRLPTQPWSAPIFDGRDVTADPLLFCMSSGTGRDAHGNEYGATCRCVTEQGTRYVVADADCRAIARHGGAYNPYRRRDSERREVRGESREETRSALAPAAALLDGAPLVQAQGRFEADAAAVKADVGEFQM